MPFGKKSGPNCPLDGFRQLEKLFIHAFSPLFWFDSPRRGVGIGSLSAVRPVKVSGGSCGVVVRGGESVQIIGAVNRAHRFAVAINNVVRAIIGGFHD